MRLRLLVALSASLFVAIALGFTVPPLEGAVNDGAGLIPAKAENALENALAGFRAKGGAHIVVLTVENLQGETIEQASIQVTDRWKIGGGTEDNGVLLMVAKEERKVRIEVGQGLEGDLTDAHSMRIIDQFILPLFRQGDFAKGIFLGVLQIAGKTNPDIELFPDSGSTAWKKQSERSFRVKDLIWIAVFILFFIFGGRSPLFAFLLGSSLGRHRSYGGWGGGGFGGRGGGGFRGGGGGFSGGGASGGW